MDEKIKRFRNPAQSILLREDPDVQKALGTYVFPNECGERYVFSVTTNNRITLDKSTALPLDLLEPEDFLHMDIPEKSSLFRNIAKDIFNNFASKIFPLRFSIKNKQNQMDKIIQTGLGYCFVSHVDIFLFMKRGRIIEPCGFMPDRTIGDRMGKETLAIFQKIGLKNGLCQTAVEQLTGEAIIPTKSNQNLLLQEAMKTMPATEILKMMKEKEDEEKKGKDTQNHGPKPPSCLKCTRRKCDGFET